MRHSNADADWYPHGPPPSAVLGRWRDGDNAWDQTNGHQFNYTERNDLSSSPVYWDPQDPCQNTAYYACTVVLYSNWIISESSSYMEFESDQ